MSSPQAPEGGDRMARRRLWRIIGAASAGTLIEWYDFYLFGSLALVLARHFFPEGNPTAALLSTLGVFATGFIVRPFGALVFGRLGDLTGRKKAFLITLLLMGGSTLAIGLLPTFSQIGLLAPILLVVLRLIQGLSIGGEYGGAATYVAEHTPARRRGYFTGYLQTTATLGLVASLVVLLLCRTLLGRERFEDWGWRLPFLGSVVLVWVSYRIRRNMNESPLFTQAQAARKLSRNPLSESFLQRDNLRLVLIVLFGFIGGHAVIWYTGHFYLLLFLQKVGGVDFVTTNLVVTGALVFSTPLYIFWGHVSDRIGRKPVAMAGLLLATAGFWPVYHGLVHFAQPLNWPVLLLLALFQMNFGTMTYGPMAAWLVELFPTRIRYTALSLPYHIGNGVVGGLTPLIASSLAESTGHDYAGLYYPIALAGATFIIGMLFLKETPDARRTELTM